MTKQRQYAILWSVNCSLMFCQPNNRQGREILCRVCWIIAMKILVIDDNGTNCDLAEIQLADHEITIVSNYEEAQDIRTGLTQDGGTVLTEKGEFDVVLVDLLMPPKRGWSEFKELMPIGVFLALLAAKNGAKFVAVFSDANHHCHPASQCFDSFNSHESSPDPFTVEKSKVFFCNNRNWVHYYYLNDLTKIVEYEDREKMTEEEREATIARGKDWKELLNYILNYK